MLSTTRLYSTVTCFEIGEKGHKVESTSNSFSEREQKIITPIKLLQFWVLMNKHSSWQKEERWPASSLSYFQKYLLAGVSQSPKDFYEKHKTMFGTLRETKGAQFYQAREASEEGIEKAFQALRKSQLITHNVILMSRK